MRFLVDECTGTRLADWLKKEGYEVFSVYEQARGSTDEDIIKKIVLKISAIALFNLQC
jgi:predicted nuclease of predicted toxin-antitoxin system